VEERLAIRALFWDIGGVLLTNAWDRHEREQAVARFQLDAIDFQDRHEMLVSSFERGQISLDEYLKRTVFYRNRTFSLEEFKAYMFSRSQPKPDALEFARQLARRNDLLMASINNESKELNAYRIDQFGLREVFDLFISSCFVSMRKPEEGIYRLALDITQCGPEECCFIDDRPLNLDTAKVLGMHTIQMTGVEQLRKDLGKLGIETPA
jgi:putative hydrolase of the HAD superfamily